MNLLDLITRKDKHLIRVGDGLAIGQVEWGGIWRSEKIPPSHILQLVLGNLHPHYTMADLLQECVARHGFKPFEIM